MDKWHVLVDPSACLGDGLCTDLAPQTFEIDEDENRARVREGDLDEPEVILAAARMCPTGAIRVYDAETGEVVFPPPKEEARPT